MGETDIGVVMIGHLKEYKIKQVTMYLLHGIYAQIPVTVSQIEAWVLATLQHGERWQDYDLVFPSTNGTPQDRDNLRRRYKRLLKKAGLPEIRFHDLRHTAATLMLNNNILVIVVSRRLGHAQPSITLDVYGHLIPTKQKEVASLMDQLLTPIQIQISE